MLRPIKYLLIAIVMTVFLYPSKTFAKERFFEIQSIDTMKFSRDMARDQKNNKDFKRIIDEQTRVIADTGATHIAIATPYDEEFLPFLRSWVHFARIYHLKVWFRGNMSGWENWFDYPSISRDEHLQAIEHFILTNPQLFEDGDIFSACPECENGGAGDPRLTGDVDGYRTFLINEYAVTKSSFAKIHKNVTSNVFSMNGDVAKLIMNRETTQALDGIVVIDHYVKTPEETLGDIHALAQQSGGKILLGEFGVPIPDIHGDMSEIEQAAWIDKLFLLLIHDPAVIGINYWTSQGSSTQLWNNNNAPRQAVKIVSAYYKPKFIQGSVVDQLGLPIAGAGVKVGTFSTSSDNRGQFTLLYIDNLEGSIAIKKKGFMKKIVSINNNQDISQFITLEREKPSFWLRILETIRSILHTLRSISV